MRVNVEAYRGWYNEQIRKVKRDKYKLVDFVYGEGINVLVLERK